MKDKCSSYDMIIRGYQPGDEERIVAFLNHSYSTEEKLESWKWANLDHPAFDKNNEFIIMRNGGEIVGYRRIVVRELLIAGIKLKTVLMGDTAIHQDLRGRGIYSWLHQVTLKAAISQGAAMAITFNSRGSITYNHNIRTGFIPIKQIGYFKIINHYKVLKRELKRLVTSNNKAKALLRNFDGVLIIKLNDQVLNVSDLIEKNECHARPKGMIQISFTEDAVPLLVSFRKGNINQRIGSLLKLLLTRKIRVKTNAPLCFVKFAWQGVRFLIYGGTSLH